MEHVSRKLIQLRRTARAMLLAQRACQWLAAMIGVVLALALIDFLLRLPAWPRLIVGVAALIVALGWLAVRLSDVLGFHPTLSALALRAERLFPQLRGSLATSVEFAAARDTAHDSPRMARFIDASVHDAQSKLTGVTLSRLLDPRRTVRFAGLLALSLAVLATAVGAFPAQAATAAQRWLMPFGQADWPRWTEVRSGVSETVWPIDEPLRMRATVQKGYHANMRTWVHYRLAPAADAAQDSPWQFSLMNDQSASPEREEVNTASTARVDSAAVGRFERIIDLPAMLEGVPAASAENATVEFYFEAGDHITAPQQLQLVARPAVRTATLHLDPPAYASDLLDAQRIALDQQTSQRATAAAFRGSTVRLELQLNKPIPVTGITVKDLAYGLPAHAAMFFTPTAAPAAPPLASDYIAFAFRLDETVETPIELTDEHALPNVSERLYRVEAIEDKPPAVAIVDPAADEAVLATALIDLAAMAQDDVAVETLRLYANIPAASSEGEPTDRITLELAQSARRTVRLSANDQLDLAQHELSIGDVVELHAGAQDVFELDGVRHEVVLATPRMLRIIDRTTLEGQMRSDLAGVRQQAVRLQMQQTDLLQTPRAQALPAQQQIQRRLADQTTQMQRLQQRMQRNRFEEPALEQLLQDAGRLLEQAQNSSRDAVDKLQEAMRQEEQQQTNEAELRDQAARQDQAAVRANLEELVNLLDQGRDAQLMQAKLRDLLQQQKNLTGDTRQLMPRTMGRTPEELSDENQAELKSQANRQRELTDQAQQLIRQMQTTAEAIARQGDHLDSQATAAAMRESAAIAQRQGLTQEMQKAEESTQANRLSQAGAEQNAAISVMQDMLRELQDRDKRRQEILRRQLAQLAEAIENLIRQQKAQIDRLQKAAALEGLDDPLSVLWRNTLSVSQTAREVHETADAASALNGAAQAQAQGIVALRALTREDAETAEALALTRLAEALALVQELAKQQAREQVQQQRAELKKAYERLAREEAQLRAATAELAALPELNRRHRAQLNELAAAQSRIRQETADLRSNVADTLLFDHLHGRIDDKAAQVSSALQQSDVGERILADEAYIAGALATMAQALEETQRSEDFATSSGGGGDGSGGGAQPPLIPPVAELKLLRGLQENVYQRTRAAGGDGNRPVDPQTLLELAGEQRELPMLAERLIEKLQAANPQPEVVPAPQIPQE